MKNRICDIFDNFDDWRHLPSYQLERRSDAFFSIYLEIILKETYGEEIQGIIPEFPVRIGTIYPKKGTNQSFKIDYLVKVKDKNKVIFVELKTDDSSRRDKQDWYLEQSKDVGFYSLLEGLLKIYRATNAKGKYRYLLKKLESFGFLTISSSGDFQVVENKYSSEIVYLQPNNEDGKENVISFYDVAEIIEQEKDEMSNRFAKSLREWASVKSGKLKKEATQSHT